MPRNNRYDKTHYGIPFGLPPRTDELAEDPRLNQQHVGREGLRAYLIEELIMSGPHLSVLVTGRRGSGKTSFVEYVLREYEHRRLRRFLLGNEGKSFLEKLWIFLLLLSTLIIIILIMEFLSLWLFGSHKKLQYDIWSISLFTIFLIIPFIITLYRIYLSGRFTFIFAAEYMIMLIILALFYLHFVNGFYPVTYGNYIWLSLILLMFALLFEYNILKKLMNESDPEEVDPVSLKWRQNESLFPSIKKAWKRLKSGRLDWIEVRSRLMQHKQLRRRLAQLLIPWHLAGMWRPSLVIRINLGFEIPTYEGVLHVMLAGLRDEYFHRFISWKSPVRLFNFLLASLLGLFVIAQASMSLFDFPKPSQPIAITQGSLQLSIDLVDKRMFNFQSLSSGNINYCGYLALADMQLASSWIRQASIPRTLCRLDEDVANPLIDFLHRPLIPFVRPEAKWENLVLARLLLPREHGLPYLIHENGWIFMTTAERHFSLRPYHLLLAAIWFWLWRWWCRRFCHHWQLYQRMSEMLDQLTGRTRVSRVWRRPLDLFRNIWGGDEEHEVEHPRFDPRSIEFFFLSLLEDLQHHKRYTLLRWPMPVPEVIFIFDELDKITGVLAPQTSLKGTVEEENKALDAERRRTYALHNLLSDMKRLISAAPARFIFIGSRLLHDEWMADAGRRQPLLTSIFDEEVYLPSLLVDRPYPQRCTGQGTPAPETVHKPWNEFPLAWRIWEYLCRSYERAKAYQVWWEREKGRHLFRITSSFLVPPDYVTTPFCEEELLYWLQGGGLRIHDLSSTCDKRVGTPLDDEWNEAIVTNFVHFLAFRSAGNPKKLKQLLTSFLRPTGRCLAHLSPAEYHRLPQEVRNSHYMLRLRDDDLYRIELISHLWRHVCGHFGQQLVQRDDKITFSVFYLLDFLMKYHNRAFSWVSLERIDELVHLHRAPDVRRLLVRLVDETAEQFLHRVLNGMYDFRFRSEFAMELRYLSRLSESEQAAFNFTLDESQSLKITYDTLIRSSDLPSYDLVMGLGELYENDQEYETAHRYYAWAIRILDNTITRNLGHDVPAVEIHRTRRKDHRKRKGEQENLQESGQAPLRLLRLITSQEFEQGYGNVRDGIWFAPWAIRRLRLMLRIGMLYEQQRNLEVALTIYAESRKFARALLKLFLARLRSDDPDRNNDATSLIEQVHLIFQPIFAEAWVLEKMGGSGDASINLVESELWWLRRTLPFVKEPCNLMDVNTLGSFRTGPGQPRLDAAQDHSSMALIMAEMHNKAGDLYFFKGRAWIPARLMKKYIRDVEDIWKQYKGTASSLADDNRASQTDGFLLRAHLHYALGIHELRRFVVFRRLASSTKYNVNLSLSHELEDRKHRTQDEVLAWSLWPASPTLSLSNNVLNMANVMLARTSILGVIKILLSCDEKEYITQTLHIGRLRKNDEILTAKEILNKFYWYVIAWIEQYHVSENEYKKIHDNLMKELKLENIAEECDNIPWTFFGKIVLEFFGQWNTEGVDCKKNYFSRDILSFKIFRYKFPSIEAVDAPASNAFDRFIGALFLAYAGTRLSGKAGAHRQQERSLLGLLETIWHILHLIHSYRELSRHQDKAREKGIPFRDDSCIWQILGLSNHPLKIEKGLEDLCSFLVDYGTFILMELDRLSRLTSRSPHAGHIERYRVGCCITPTALTLAIGLAEIAIKVLSADKLEEDSLACPEARECMVKADANEQTEEFIKKHKKIYPILHIIERWTKYSQKRQSNSIEEWLSKVLDEALLRHRFPILNRLLALRMILDRDALDLCNFANDYPDLNEVEAALTCIENRFDELVELYDRYDAHLHFTPAQLARTSMSVVISLHLLLKEARDRWNPADDKMRERMKTIRERMETLYNKALRVSLDKLNKAKESYTMGYKYYKDINDLYYLYDDFNDRHIHLQRALQMMSMEMQSILLDICLQLDQRAC